MNHTSDQNPWFLESRSSRTNPKRDWYIWRDGKADGGPPNNWQSWFGHSAWTLDPKTGQYYYHYFYVQQPDLNWRNPEVEQAMYGRDAFLAGQAAWPASASMRSHGSSRTRICATTLSLPGKQCVRRSEHRAQDTPTICPRCTTCSRKLRKRGGQISGRPGGDL